MIGKSRISPSPENHSSHASRTKCSSCTDTTIGPIGPNSATKKHFLATTLVRLTATSPVLWAMSFGPTAPAANPSQLRPWRKGTPLRCTGRTKLQSCPRYDRRNKFPPRGNTTAPAANPSQLRPMAQGTPLRCTSRTKLQSCPRYDRQNKFPLRKHHCTHRQAVSATTMAQKNAPQMHRSDQAPKLPQIRPSELSRTEP